MKLVKICITIVLVAIIGLVIAWNMAPGLIASSLSKKMQVSVKIDDISLSTNTITVKDIEIGNPSGSTLPKAFSVERIQVKAPLTNYVKDAISIDEIALNDVSVDIEFANPSALTGNWGKIIENLKKGSTSKPQANETKKGTSVLIKKLILTDVQVTLVNGLEGGKVQKLTPIPRIELDNVSSESGAPIEQIMLLILEQTFSSVVKNQNLGGVLQKTIETPKGLFDKLTAPFQK